jgi:hypothetical protein
MAEPRIAPIVAEPLPGELLQMLGPAPADVDAVLAHVRGAFYTPAQ